VFQATFLIVMLFAGKQIFGLSYDENTEFYAPDANGSL
jgi:hypothetical protein